VRPDSRHNSAAAAPRRAVGVLAEESRRKRELSAGIDDASSRALSEGGKRKKRRGWRRKRRGGRDRCLIRIASRSRQRLISTPPRLDALQLTLASRFTPHAPWLAHDEPLQAQPGIRLLLQRRLHALPLPLHLLLARTRIKEAQHRNVLQLRRARGGDGWRWEEGGGEEMQQCSVVRRVQSALARLGAWRVRCHSPALLS
jgi:hypothetical protein